jgi:hypothetical protein
MFRLRRNRSQKRRSQMRTKQKNKKKKRVDAVHRLACLWPFLRVLPLTFLLACSRFRMLVDGVSKQCPPALTGVPVHVDFAEDKRTVSLSYSLTSLWPRDVV